MTDIQEDYSYRNARAGASRAALSAGSSAASRQMMTAAMAMITTKTGLITAGISAWP